MNADVAGSPAADAAAVAAVVDDEAVAAVAWTQGLPYLWQN